MSQITKLYIEPTSHCNLDCQMCSRKNWQKEAICHMELSIFSKTIEELPCSVQTIFFGGIGEPLTHPNIIDMIKSAKKAGVRVELITNGTLLSEDISIALIDAKLDMLWISLDTYDTQASPYLGHSQSSSTTIDNIKAFNKIRFSPFDYTPRLSHGIEYEKIKLGIAFVLMKSNQNQFTKLLKEKDSLGISSIKATHLIAYAEENLKEICYDNILERHMYNMPNNISTSVDIPFVTSSYMTELVPYIISPSLKFSIMGQNIGIDSTSCAFIDNNITFVRADGVVCPCMALLHDNVVYQKGGKKNIEQKVNSANFGNIAKDTLANIWDSKEYTEFRDRVKNKKFSPCFTCALDVCEFVEDNTRDCFDNHFPVCGACLWGQGLIQCP